MSASLLPLAWLLAGAAAAAGVGPNSGLCPYNPEPAAWTADGPECAVFSLIEERFHRLAAAGGFGSGELRLLPGAQHAGLYEARYYDKSRGIAFSRDFIACHRSKPRGIAAIIAHELGHAVQHREGRLAANLELQGSESKAAAAIVNRKLEAEADAIGDELLRRAGYDETMADFVVNLNACSGTPDKRSFESFTHPSDAFRWLEGVRDRERGRQAEAEAKTRGQAGAEGSRFDERTLAREYLGEDREPEAGVQRTVYLPSGFSVRAGTFRTEPEARWENRDRLGRAWSDVRLSERGIPSPFDEPGQKSVILPDGSLWMIPPAYRAYSPAEIIAFVMKGGTVPESVGAAFEAGLERLQGPSGKRRLPGALVTPPNAP